VSERRASGPLPEASRVTPARRTAYEVLRRTFEQDAWTDRAFPSAADRNRLDRRARAQAQRLAYGAVQRRGTADRLISRIARRATREIDPPLQAAMRLGVYELLFASATPDHAAVDQAVELAKAGAGGGRRAGAAAGLVNAVLRRVAAERDALLGDLGDTTPEAAATAHSYPEWLAAMWWEELGAEAARSLMAAMNQPSETSVRANTLRVDPVALADELRSSGQGLARSKASGPLHPDESIVLSGPLTEPTRRRIAAGDLVPQSRGSQAVVAVLDPRPGDRVLDLCAAPGIKTTAIAARMEDAGEVVAVELDPGRARQLRELCERLDATCVQVVEGDASRIDIGAGYDRVLVDPPCSDLGTLGSRPDARWRKSPELIERLAAIQAPILSRGARAVRRDGTLVYATCTISRRENECQLASLLAADRSLRADDLGRDHPALASDRDRRFLQTRPDRDGTDGFFIARVRR
jgi:16S rRNA (cytosine967-C5)-methyltransferase